VSARDDVIRLVTEHGQKALIEIIKEL